MHQTDSTTAHEEGLGVCVIKNRVHQQAQLNQTLRVFRVKYFLFLSLKEKEIIISFLHYICLKGG